MANEQTSQEENIIQAGGSTKGRCRVRFQVEAEPGSRVAVAGNFNEWNPKLHPLRETKEPGRFERLVYLQPGDYQYKFVIDGAWSADPNCPSFTPNAYGTLNSVLRVQPSVAKRRRKPVVAGATTKKQTEGRRSAGGRRKGAGDPRPTTAPPPLRQEPAAVPDEKMAARRAASSAPSGGASSGQARATA